MEIGRSSLGPLIALSRPLDPSNPRPLERLERRVFALQKLDFLRRAVTAEDGVSVWKATESLDDVAMHLGVTEIVRERTLLIRGHLVPERGEEIDTPLLRGPIFAM